jgi:GT2 family glycosyltransferase
MAQPLISLIHPTARVAPSAGFPLGWRGAERQFFAAAEHPELIEYVLAIDLAQWEEAQEHLSFSPWLRATAVCNRGRCNAVDATNAAAGAATGALIVHSTDDYEAPPGWDTLLLAAASDLGREALVHCSSGGARDHELYIPHIITRVRLDKLGYFFHPSYRSMYADDELCRHADADPACAVIEAQHIKFKHDHPIITGRPRDAVYRHEDNPETHAQGLSNFNARQAQGFPALPPEPPRFSLLMPHDAGPAQCERITAWLAEHYRKLLPEAELLIGGLGHQPPNRSANRNSLAAQATTDLLVFLDDAVLLDPEDIRAAVRIAESTGSMVRFSRVAWVDRTPQPAPYRGAAPYTEAILQAAPGIPVSVPAAAIYSTISNPCGMINAVRRNVFERIGRWDETYVGWGEEDVAFGLAAETLASVHILDATGYHLWHPRAGEQDQGSPSHQRNVARSKAYHKARGDATAMRYLIEHRRPEVLSVPEPVQPPPAARKEWRGEGLSILLPHDPGDPRRDRIVAWLEKRWRHYFPQAQILVAGTGRRNRAANRNALARQATGQVLAFLDADCLLATEAVRQAFSAAQDGQTVAKFGTVAWIGERATRRILAGNPRRTCPVEAGDRVRAGQRLPGLAWFVSRETFDSLGGFDERFQGWGGEDNAFTYAAEALASLTWLPLTAYHLNHGAGEAANKMAGNTAPEYAANQQLAAQYKAARHDPEAMGELIRCATSEVLVP